jgi:hypothetical protein
LKKQKTKTEKKQKKQKAKNMRIFRKIIKDKNTMNDFSFYEKLDTENQKKIIKELMSERFYGWVEDCAQRTTTWPSITLRLRSLRSLSR